MPYVYPNPRKLINQPLVGDGNCIALIKTHVPGLKGIPTSAWKAGVRVMEAKGSIVPGTAIATFVNGKYLNQPTGNHAAIVLQVESSGILVVDQWKNDRANRPVLRSRWIRVPPALEVRRSDGSFAMPSNNAEAFYVIEK